MRLCVSFLAISGISGAACTAAAQQQYSVPAQVTFRFDRQGLEVPKFTLQIDENGLGRYEAEQVFPAAAGTAVAAATQQINRTLSLSRATANQIFDTARALDRFNVPCASSAKNIADTGKKMLEYKGPDGGGSCSYNYSEDKRVALLTDLFQAIAHTMDLGRKLDFDRRFDRLGLDAETASLVDEVTAGRAAELGTITAALQSISSDSQLMERVRLRAARLLEQSQAQGSARPAH